MASAGRRGACRTAPAEPQRQARSEASVRSARDAGLACARRAHTRRCWTALLSAATTSSLLLHRLPSSSICSFVPPSLKKITNNKIRRYSLYSVLEDEFVETDGYEFSERGSDLSWAWKLRVPRGLPPAGMLDRVLLLTPLLLCKREWQGAASEFACKKSP